MTVNALLTEVTDMKLTEEDNFRRLLPQTVFVLKSLADRLCCHLSQLNNKISIIVSLYSSHNTAYLDVSNR